MILLIDNYDSFSYNLVQLFGTLCLENRISLTPSRPGESAGSQRISGTFIRTTSSSLPDPDIQKMPVSVRMWSAR